MRISDWSSDVCSSDLRVGQRIEIMDGQADRALAREQSLEIVEPGFGVEPRDVGRILAIIEQHRQDAQPRRRRDDRLERSEEHTSELQSLMRTSYAVFCLKQKTNTITYTNKHMPQNTED